MPSWLTIWIGRYSLGERWRKATSDDYRSAFGHFLFMPIVLILATTVGDPFMSRASAAAIWAMMTLLMVIYVFGLRLFWVKFVRASVSLFLGVIAWAVLAWISL